MVNRKTNKKDSRLNNYVWMFETAKDISYLRQHRLN